MTDKKLDLAFYQNTGKLFYAVAKADRMVRDEEFKALKTSVKKEWLMLDETEYVFGKDAAYQLETIFNWLLSKNFDAEQCYNDFVDYYKANNHLFNKKIRILILKTANTIASTFSGKNKSELIMLANINILFKTAPQKIV